MSYDFTFEGPGKTQKVNLSTATTTSSSTLLSTVRAQRQAREEARKREIAALRIQKRWRRFVAVKKAREELLSYLEGGELIGVEARARGLVVLLRGGLGDTTQTSRIGKLLESWCTLGQDPAAGSDARAYLAPLARSEDYATILALLSSHILGIVAMRPTTTQAANLLSSLEFILDSKSYSFLPTDQAANVKQELVGSIGRLGWVEVLVESLEKLITASAPKKKHPHIQPVIRLLTAPLSFHSKSPDSPLVLPLLQRLLTVPALPSSIPIPSLTHLSAHLPLFTLLLPLAAENPSLLNQDKLATELGKTYFLANIATFGITGGMLARYGTKESMAWIKVISTLLLGVDEVWGKWAEGIPEEEDVDEAMPLVNNDSDDEDEPAPLPKSTATAPFFPSINVPLPAKPKRRRRTPLPANITSKLILLTSANHLSTLSTQLVSPSSKSPTSSLTDYAVFSHALLRVFRGSARWEAILEGLLDGVKGRGLIRRLWREGVRGKWSGDAKQNWDTFSQNPATPILLLLTHLYNHYLLLTPDDEFFSTENGSNPFSLDEVLELAAIWRDMAYWGYMGGVAAGGAVPSKGVGTEEVRGMFTRGVTRVAERNARRKFASEDFWVMVPKKELSSFVKAAVFEDAELALPGGTEEESTNPADMPRWEQARQRFTKRQLAFISPRLGLLNNLPMTVPFQTRLEVFREFVDADYVRSGVHRRSRRHGLRATIHRTSLAEDGFRQLGSFGPALKGTIQITFIDQFGEEESGIDGGGLFKEFLTSLSKEVFDTNRGLWLSTGQNLLYPNSHSYAVEAHQLNWYEFIGRVLGKALYEGILVDVGFAPFFLAKWLGRQSYLDDLNSLDKELYKGLIILKNYPKPEELSLTFTLSEQEFGEIKNVDLIPGGSDIAVTAENRHEYIQLVCKYKLDKQISRQSRAFFDGLSDIIDPKWLRMFDQSELQQLIGGEETPIDMDDLRAHTVVHGFPNDDTMRLFWKVVKGFNQTERKALLRFVTSCSRPPLLGFSQLNPKFGIRWSSSDVTRLPSASSCANLLKLPGYTDEYQLRTKLLQAITSGAGFDLS